MPTPPPNLTRLIKLLMLTQSDQDFEALAALRKANAMLAAQNMNWEEFITNRITWREERKDPDSKKESKPKGKLYTDEDEINEYFDTLLTTVSPNDSFFEFIQSVHEWWMDKGFLTERQYEVIKSAARRRAA